MSTSKRLEKLPTSSFKGEKSSFRSPVLISTPKNLAVQTHKLGLRRTRDIQQILFNSQDGFSLAKNKKPASALFMCTTVSQFKNWHWNTQFISITSNRFMVMYKWILRKNFLYGTHNHIVKYNNLWTYFDLRVWFFVLFTRSTRKSTMRRPFTHISETKPSLWKLKRKRKTKKPLKIIILKQLSTDKLKCYGC